MRALQYSTMFAWKADEVGDVNSHTAPLKNYDCPSKASHIYIYISGARGLEKSVDVESAEVCLI